MSTFVNCFWRSFLRHTVATVIERVDLNEIAYDTAVAEMTRWREERVAGAVGDRLFLLSHPPVVTYGPRTDPGDLPADLGVRAVPVDRGGYATYHGPGQLVGYVILDVRTRGPVDIVRWLENGLVTAVRALATRPCAATRRRESRASWCLDRGRPQARVHRDAHPPGVTSHGFALNVHPDMSVFDRFTVCGLHDVTMVSLERLAAERGTPPPPDAAVRDAVAEALGAYPAQTA